LFTGEPAWVASRYEDIRAALTDPRTSANTLPESLRPGRVDDDAPVFFARTDDPEHNRLRRMLTRDFTVRRAKEMAPDIQKLVDDFLDKMIAAGPPCDLVREFALPVPGAGCARSEHRRKPRPGNRKGPSGTATPRAGAPISSRPRYRLGPVSTIFSRRRAKPMPSTTFRCSWIRRCTT
jgi:hypothetical protein